MATAHPTISSPIADFYKNKSILITGATGFLGKVLVEKLLRSCSAVNNIYLLLRPKKGQEPKERLEELLNVEIFERVKKEQPGSLSKIVVICGDITLPGLGISASDKLLLTSNVSLVFHSAATINFDVPLKESINLNVLGTRRLVELCHEMNNLEAFVHVSTAYCNCDRDQIDEVVYELSVSPHRIIDTIEWMDEDMVSVLTPHLLKGRPNTYTYTKSLTERLLVEESRSLPIAIVRPSMVTGAWREPYPGWIDNFSGPTGIIYAAGKGVIRSVHCKSAYTVDVIPVDVVINLLIAVAWDTAVQRPENLQVYNCSSGSLNRLTYEHMTNVVSEMIIRYPSDEVFFYPNISITDFKTWNSCLVLLFNYIPAHLLDMFSVLTGRKPELVPIYKKLDKLLQSFSYFSINEWGFSTNNVLRLLEKLAPEDKQVFYFDIRSLDWPTYLENFVLGIRRFLMKEEVSTLPAARKKLRWLNMKIKALYFVIFCFALMRYNRASRQMFYTFLCTVMQYATKRNIKSS